LNFRKLLLSKLQKSFYQLKHKSYFSEFLVVVEAPKQQQLNQWNDHYHLHHPVEFVYLYLKD